MSENVTNQNDVDNWIKDNCEYTADRLLDEKLPKMRAKLNRLDRRIQEVLSEVQAEFPDACYYTASGGFNLILGDTHDGPRQTAQNQRTAWNGSACIGDGDW